MARINLFNKNYNSFCTLAKYTNIFSELYKETSAIAAIVFAIMFGILLSVLLFCNQQNFFELAKNLTGILLPALIGLLGFYVAGLAMLSSLVNNDIVEILSERSQIERLIGVLTCYYFAGVIVLVTIVSFIAAYIFLSFDHMPYMPLVYISNFALSYLFFLSVCYTVALLGNCINFFILINSLKLQIKDKKNVK